MKCDECNLDAVDECRCTGGPVMYISAYDYDYIVCDGDCTSPANHAANCETA